MNKSFRNKLLTTLLALAVFVIFTVAVLTVDVVSVEPADYSGSSAERTTIRIGFASLNVPFAHRIGFSQAWYSVSDILGYVSLLTAAAFGFVGLIRLIKRKNLWAVGGNILALGVFYIIVISLYVIFSKVAINYRPVFTEAEPWLEASYPSSHTMLGLCVMITAAVEVSGIVKNKAAAKVLFALFTLLALLALFSRLLSGIHWLTDIFGSIILSAALLSLWSLLREIVTDFCAKMLRTKS